MTYFMASEIKVFWTRVTASYSFPSIYKTVPTTWKVVKTVTEPKVPWHALATRWHSEQMLNHVNWWNMKYFFLDFILTRAGSQDIYHAIRTVIATSLHFLNFVYISRPFGQVLHPQHRQAPGTTACLLTASPPLVLSSPDSTPPRPCLCLPKPVELIFLFLRCS